jgi:hypothetical protein
VATAFLRSTSFAVPSFEVAPHKITPFTTQFQHQHIPPQSYAAMLLHACERRMASTNFRAV